MKTKHWVLIFFLVAVIMAATASTFAANGGWRGIRWDGQPRMGTGERSPFWSGINMGSGMRHEPKFCNSWTTQTGVCPRIGTGDKPFFGSWQYMWTGSMKPRFWSGDKIWSGNKEKMKLKNVVKLGSGNAATLSSWFREKVKGLTGEKASLFKTLWKSLFWSSSE